MSQATVKPQPLLPDEKAKEKQENSKMAPFCEELGSDQEVGPSENGATSGSENDSRSSSQKDYTEFSVTDNSASISDYGSKDSFQWDGAFDSPQPQIQPPAVRKVLPSLDEELDKEQEEEIQVAAPLNVPSYRLQREREASMAEEEEENYFKNEWPKHEKHIFILSNAGKPVYSRYGDEQKLCSFMPVLSAISSFVTEAGDTIRTIVAGEHVFVFLFKGPLYLVAISKAGEPPSHVARQLEYIHSQILSSLTSGVNRIYETRAHFDIRTLLGSATEYLDSLVDMMDNNVPYIASFVLNAVASLRIDSSMRYTIGSILQSFHTNELVYSIIVARRQLVHLVRLKKHALQAEDFHLVLNFLVSNTSIHEPSTSTVPVCLPKFNDRGYLHIFVSMLIPEVYLLLVSTKPGDFDGAKMKLAKGLNDSGALAAIQESLDRTEGDLFYRLSDVEGLENRSSSPPVSPASSPTVPSYLVHKKPQQQQQQHNAHSIHRVQSDQSLYSLSSWNSSSPGKFMNSLFSPSSSNSTPTATTPSSPATFVTTPNGRSYSHSTPSSPHPKTQHPHSPYATATTTPTTRHHASTFPLPPDRNFLLHFLYKDHKTNQFTCPRLEPPYNSPAEQKRLFRVYQHVYVMANGAVWQENNSDGAGSQSASSSSSKKKNKNKKPHKVYYHISDRESVLAWLTPTFELYATFGPMAAKSNAIRICNQLLRWVKSEEEHLFIQNTPVW